MPVQLCTSRSVTQRPIKERSIPPSKSSYENGCSRCPPARARFEHSWFPMATDRRTCSCIQFGHSFHRDVRRCIEATCSAYKKSFVFCWCSTKLRSGSTTRSCFWQSVSGCSKKIGQLFVICKCSKWIMLLMKNFKMNYYYYHYDSGEIYGRKSRGRHPNEWFASMITVSYSEKTVVLRFFLYEAVLPPGNVARK